MFNRYLVKCPQFGCGWSGLIAADSAVAWPVVAVDLQCPCCQHEWQGRVIGDRVKDMPLEDSEDLELAAWPPVEFGVGD